MKTSCGRLQCMQKINFIIHFFLKILHFKESFNLIINNNISLHFRLFSRKTNMTQIFQEIQKTLFWDHSGPFLAQIRAKINFPGKKGSVSF